MYQTKDKLAQKKQTIEELITHYLHKNNELCLAGFGRFAAQVHEFMVDPVAKKVQPAHRKIYFQVGDFGNSELFLDFCSGVLGEEKGVVVDKLTQFTQNLLQSVQDVKRLEIAHLGVFKFNVMGELDFESYSREAFNDLTFGLKPVHFAANLLKTKRMVVEKVDEKEELELTQMRESALKELKSMLDQARIAESNQPKKGTKLFPIVATVLTLILLINLGFFLFNGPVSGLREQISQMNILGKTGELLDTQTAKTVTAPIENKVETAPALTPITQDDLVFSIDSIGAHIGLYMQKEGVYFDSSNYTQIPETKMYQETFVANPVDQQVKQKEEEIIADATAQVLKSKETEAPNMVNVDAAKNGIDQGFYVVAGAFKNESNANRLKETLLKQGDSSATIIKPANYPYFLVAFKNASTLNQALNLLEKKQVSQPSVWVYCAY